GVVLTYAFTGATIGSGAGSANGSTFNKGVTHVTYTVTDTSMNTSSCTFDVTVFDNQNPTTTCPGNITQNADPGVCNAVVSWPAPASSDNCGATTVVCTPA